MLIHLVLRFFNSMLCSCILRPIFSTFARDLEYVFEGVIALMVFLLSWDLNGLFCRSQDYVLVFERLTLLAGRSISAVGVMQYSRAFLKLRADIKGVAAFDCGNLAGYSLSVEIERFSF